MAGLLPPALIAVFDGLRTSSDSPLLELSLLAFLLYSLLLLPLEDPLDEEPESESESD